MSDVAAYHVLFPVQGGSQSTHLSLHYKQYMICCHITH